tara:strand:- start:163 stop:288 length:126 start_codon:yes stop_codon:yes gene_type:complete
LVPDSNNASSEEINIERISVAKWGACYRQKFNDLVMWVKGK